MTKTQCFFSARLSEDGTVQTLGVSHCHLGSEPEGRQLPQDSRVFAQWTWDGSQLHASNDYSGYLPLFYSWNAREIFVSGSLGQLAALGVPLDWDEAALGVFYRCGFFLGDHTPFKNVKVLPPGATLTWERGVLSLSASRRLPKPQPLSAEQAIEGYIESFRAAIRRHALPPEGTALPLTGGRDSRQIALELGRMGKLPRRCVTCGDGRDIQSANQLASRLGLSQTVIAPSQRPVKDSLEKNERTHFCALEHTWLLPLWEYLKSEFINSYEGTGVGVLTRTELLDRSFIELHEGNQLHTIGKTLFERIGPGEAFFKRLPSEFSFLARSEDSAIELFARELDSLADAASPLSALSFWSWGRRAISLNPFALMTGLSQISTPFLDRDLYDFVASLPVGVILEQEPQTAAIRRAFPEYADIPFYDELPQARARFDKSAVQRVINARDRLRAMAAHMPKALLPMLRLNVSEEKGHQRNARVNALLHLAQLSHLQRHGAAQGHHQE